MRLPGRPPIIPNKHGTKEERIINGFYDLQVREILTLFFRNAEKGEYVSAVSILSEVCRAPREKQKEWVKVCGARRNAVAVEDRRVGRSADVYYLYTSGFVY